LTALLLRVLSVLAGETEGGVLGGGGGGETVETNSNEASPQTDEM
jgi:hypothetical protein